MLDRRCLALLPLLFLGCRDRGDAPAPSADSTANESDTGVVPDDPLADLEDRAFPLLVWSAYRVEQEYFDKERFDPREQLLSAVQFLGLHSPEFFAEPNAGGGLVVKVRSRSASFGLDDVTSLQKAADRLEEILVFTQDVLDLDPEPLHELEYTAINGLFAPLDPHTILLSPEEHDDLGVRTRGHFGGIGAQIRAEDRRIIVVRVLPGMPAEKAGMKAGDVVLTIDGAATVNMPAEDAQALLRGPVGEVVVVVVRRGTQTLSLPITRDTIHVDSVEKAMLPGKVAYLRISTFQENTGEQVQAALQELAGEQGAGGVVLDLRGNSGGLLTQATAVVDTMVQRGELVIVRSAMGREAEDATDAMALADGTPVVVLLDEDSASAAEIVGGGLKALGRGVVLGRSSFGKGTVQMVKPASPYGRELALKLTVAEYLVAGDRTIQSLGVLPDLELLPVEMTAIPGIARFFDEERFERQRERSRTAHLPSAKHHPSLPPDHVALSRLRYLYSGEVPAELRALTDDVEVLDRLQDPEIRIAREVALGLQGTGDREQRAAALRAVAGRLAATEDDRIEAALADASVDWSDSPSPSKAELAVEASLVESGPVAAGEPFVMRVEVENRGKAPVERVHGITDCVHDELDGIELLVGKIDPGQTVVRDLKLHVMPWHSDFTDVLALDVHVGEPDEQPDARTEVRFSVAGASRPSLSYSWWIVDDPALAAAAPKRPQTPLLKGEVPFEVKGNGDGMLQPGERVLLAFEARNDGPGVSPDVRAVLRNGSAAQGLLEEGAVTLGKMPAGARARGAFGITVNESADPAQPFEVELVIGDAQVRERAGDELRLRVLSDVPTVVRKEASVRVGKEPLRVYNGAHASAPVVLELPEGSVVSTVGEVGPWRVLELPNDGRRLFVPADLGEVAGSVKKRPKGDPLDAVRKEALVLPPGLQLEAVPRVVEDAHVKLRGTATHPRRVRDVAVLVRPPGASQIDRKVSYTASPDNQAGAQSLTFEAEVPLEPGGNRITILVRDGRKVERREDVWVFREGPG
ncbi:MXAN_5808 family serine peptidase [Paraliomyxa miuraensis]|uniref:MXAN_5808 family serine peptidase n=1 Tax=Paraliomyxa miuraensis TaxID=376150 RepID=UPI002254BD0B|nr:MXAN_5808 family serine peptidase [Paraliomyxa miuraensis]MCX4245159.1 S41 family peptidase [Paraliomyxa miuraensis]